MAGEISMMGEVATQQAERHITPTRPSSRADATLGIC